MLITLVNPPTLMRNSNAATVTPSPPLGLAYIVLGGEHATAAFEKILLSFP